MINLKEDWLDNVTEEQLRGFFEHSKLAKIKPASTKQNLVNEDIAQASAISS